MSFQTNSKVPNLITTFPVAGESDADRQVSKRFGVSAPPKVEELAYPSQTAPPSIATPAMDTDGESDVGGDGGSGEGYLETKVGEACDSGGGGGSTGHVGVSSFPDLPWDDETPLAIPSASGLSTTAATSNHPLLSPSDASAAPAAGAVGGDTGLRHDDSPAAVSPGAVGTTTAQGGGVSPAASFPATPERVGSDARGDWGGSVGRPSPVPSVRCVPTLSDLAVRLDFPVCWLRVARGHFMYQQAFSGVLSKKFKNTWCDPLPRQSPQDGSIVNLLDTLGECTEIGAPCGCKLTRHSICIALHYSFGLSGIRARFDHLVSVRQR